MCINRHCYRLDNNGWIISSCTDTFAHNGSFPHKLNHLKHRCARRDLAAGDLFQCFETVLLLRRDVMPPLDTSIETLKVSVTIFNNKEFHESVWKYTRCCHVHFPFMCISHVLDTSCFPDSIINRCCCKSNIMFWYKMYLWLYFVHLMRDNTLTTNQNPFQFKGLARLNSKAAAGELYIQRLFISVGLVVYLVIVMTLS